jgi:hypothetical protein
MAMGMTVTDGVNTVNLAATDAYCLSFGVETPSVSAETATDRHEIEFFGGTNTIATNVAKLNRLLEQAVRWQRSREGPRVFVTYHLDGGNLHRSEVVDGAYQMTPEMVNGERAHGTRKGTLTIVRKNWLEQAEVTATIASANADGRAYVDGSYTGTSPTKKVNYWDIDARSLAGDLPAPTRIKYALPDWDSGVTTYAPNLYVTLARSAAQLETGAMESVWWEDGGSSWTDDFDASLTIGNMQVRTVAADPEFESFAPTAGTYINRFGSDVGFYRLFVRAMVDTPGTYKLTPTLEDGAGFYRYGKSFYKTFGAAGLELVDCGGMYLPAAYSTAKALTATVKFGLTVHGMNGVELSVDWAHFMRADGWKKYVTLNATDQVVEDDQIDGSAVYSVALGGSTRESDLVAEGDPACLSLVPGKWHRFYVHGDYSGGLPIFAYVTPTVIYRPRFLALV